MIGTKFFKPLQENKIPVYGEFKYEVENPETGEKHIETRKEIIDYEDNPAPNTLKKYSEAAAWCTETQKGTIKEFSEGEGDAKVEWFEVVPLVIPEPTAEEKADRIRAERDAQLDATQWMIDRHREEKEMAKAKAIPGTTLSETEYAELVAYRQALRNVPQQETFPDAVTWPEKPKFVK